MLCVSEVVGRLSGTPTPPNPRQWVVSCSVSLRVRIPGGGESHHHITPPSHHMPLSAFLLGRPSPRLWTRPVGSHILGGTIHSCIPYSMPFRPGISYSPPGSHSWPRQTVLVVFKCPRLSEDYYDYYHKLCDWFLLRAGVAPVLYLAWVGFCAVPCVPGALHCTLHS